MKKLMLLLLLAGVAEASGRPDPGFNGTDGYGYVLTAPIAGVFGRNPSPGLKSNQLIDDYMAERRLNLEMGESERDTQLTARVEKVERARPRPRRRRNR